MARGTADTSLTKAAYSKVMYDQRTLKDFSNCCDPENGALYFMVNHMRIQHPTRGSINFEPFDYQLDLVENYNNNRFSINMLGRQMGKCLTKKISITIRNKKGEIYDIPIGLFYEYEKAKRDGTERPDISIFKRSKQYM
jgi:hypothetical protein